LALNRSICSRGILGSSERYRANGSVPELLAKKNKREITTTKVINLDTVLFAMYAIS
jgi:hypothetical protein